MIQFASPWLLAALCAVPLVAAAYAWALRRAKGSVRVPGLASFQGFRPGMWARLRHAPIVLRVAALALLALAFARPQSGSSQEEILTRGIDIVMTLDNSTSMAAEDFKPHNRLAVARTAVSTFIQGRKNDRIGLVVFAGRGYTRCPLTLDYDILQQLVGGVELATQDEGTAIGMGIVTAINRLRDSDAKSRVIVLLTDGRNNRGEIDPSTAASLALSLGIKIYAIGVGTRGEAPYPIQDPFFGKRYVYLKADIDDDTLTAIAKQTGGEYFRATDSESLASIFRQIDGMEKTDVKVRHFTRYTELGGWLMLPAAVLLAAEAGLSRTRLRRLP